MVNIFDHIQDHSRLGLENKFLENKSRQLFLRSTGLLYKFLPTNLGVCKPTFYTCYTLHLRWNSTIYHTDLGQNAVFHSFARQISRNQYSGRSSNAPSLHNKLKNWPHYKTFSSRESYNVGTVQSQQSASMWYADNNGLLANTFKKFSYSPLWLAGSHFFAKFAVRAVNVWMNINRVTL